MGLTVLDTGVLIGFLDSTDAHHARATRALAVARTAGEPMAVPASAYAELLVQPAKRGGRDVKLVEEALDALAITIEPLSRPVAKEAAHLRARFPRLRLPDALVVATATSLKATRVLTTDRGWPRIPAMRIEVV